MPLTREAGKALAGAGLIAVMQKGKPLDPDSAKGPIRYKLVDAAPPPQQ